MAETKRSGTVRFAVAAGLILALLPAAWFLVLRDPPAPVAAPVDRPDAAATPLAAVPSEPVRAPDLTLAEFAGRVEVRRARGEFSMATAGMVLRADDAIRTADGRARLVGGDVYEVQVLPGTSLEIGELKARLSRFRLDSGMLVARVEGRAGLRLEVAAASSDAVATATDGAFAMSNNGDGTVAVGARAGEVEFSAGGKAVLLRAGQQSLANGGAPSEPAPIPSSLYLKVDWPGGGEVNQRKLSLSGRTAPGAVVLVAGQPARVDRDGRFNAAVRLREGRNTLAAESLDVGGNQALGKAEVTVDTTAPDANISTGGLWGR